MTDVEFLLNCYIEDNKPIRNEDEKYSLKCKLCSGAVTFSSHEIIIEKFKDGTIYDGIIHDAECRWYEAVVRLDGKHK